MKRIAIAICSLLLIASITATNIFAVMPIKIGAETKTSGLSTPGFEGADEAFSAYLIEATTGKVLYSKNEFSSAAPASVTKIMTLLLVAEALSDGRIKAEDTVSVSSYAAAKGGSQVFLKEGERISVLDLLKSTIIASANDAAAALAELIAGSEASFVKMMNKRAGELGLKNTAFENATGLDDTTTNHYTCAADIAKMSRELIKHDIILEYSSVWQDSIRNGEFILTNTNRLVRYYDGCNGLKTGSTDKAGYCISAAAKRGNMQLIAVIMGAPTRDIRNNIARELLDFGFANFSLYENKSKTLEKVPVVRGVADSVDVYSKDFSVVIPKNKEAYVEELYEIPESIKAPLKAGETVGKIIYRIDGEQIGYSDICLSSDVGEISYFDLFIGIIKKIFVG